MKGKHVCEQCGKEFDSPQALGRQMLGHRGNSEPEELPSTEQAGSSEEPSEAEGIREYLEQGFSFEQLTKKLGFKPSAVRREMAKYLTPGEEPAQSGGKEETGLTILKDKEVIPPEFLLREIELPDDSYDEEALKAWTKGIEDGFKLLFAGVRVMQQLQKSQLEMYKSVKSSESEVAERAAREAASQVAGYFERTQPWKQVQVQSSGGPSERMMGPVADMIAQQMAGLIGRVLGAAGGTQGQGQSSPALPQGWTYEKKEGQ